MRKARRISNIPILLTFLCAGILSGQHHVISGLIIDAETFHPLPSASIRVVGSTKGTISNAAGQFRITLPPGKHLIAVSYVGYQSDTAVIDLDSNVFRGIRLYPNSIQLAGVTVTDEDPAFEIIRRAIESKKKWRGKLRNLRGKAFNRLQIRTDSSIAAITEAYSTLYWRNDDSLREVITQQKKTGNLPGTFQPSRVGEIINFNDDKIKVNGFVFAGPTAPNAFEYYDYKLLSVGRTDDFEVYTIELTPRSKTIPLFRGQITISERSYAVINVDVRPNEAFTQPLINTKKSRYQQKFQLYDNTFWLPVNYRFEGTFEISIMALSFPAFGIERDVVIYEYDINPAFEDSVAAMKVFTVDSSAKVIDSVFWSANSVLPLTEEQESAYSFLDSTQTLDKKFAPKGAGALLLNVTGNTFGYIDAWFNRVEGLHLGVSKSFRNVSPDIDLRGGVGYGLSDKQWKAEAGATFHLGKNLSSSGNTGFANMRIDRKEYALNVDIYDRIKYFPEPYLPGLLLNSFACLLLKDDVQDYYRTIGSTIEISHALTPLTRYSVSALHERQLSVYQTTNYSWVSNIIPYPNQPSIINGRMNSITFALKTGSSPIFGLAKDAYLFDGSIEHSSPVAGGDFEFTKLTGKVRGKAATMLKEEAAFPPTLSFQFSFGSSFGRIPPQRYYELYSKFETLAGYGVLRVLPRREFYGDRFVTLTVDHNFRRLLFAPLGIQWLSESNLELIIEGNIARSWMSSSALRTPLFPSGDSNGWYFESSIGISNVFDLFRIDFSRRFSSPSGWAFSITVSDFLSGLISP